MNKRISGILLSYLTLIADMLVGILFVPLLLRNLGDVEYGLYKLMFSTASYLSVLDFGIGSTITRYVIKFRTEKRIKEEENFVAMGLIVYGGLAGLILLLAICIAMAIPKLYASSVSTDQMQYAQVLFFLICANTSITFFNHAYNGLLVAFEKFTFSKLSNLAKIIVRVILISVFTSIYHSSSFIVFTDIALSVLLLFVNVLYTKFKLNYRIKLHKWDNVLLKEAFVFTLAILAQSIINQFNSNVDNIVLGVFTTTSTVAVYSVAIQLFTMYSNLSTAVSSIYLPSVSKAVFKGENDNQITQKIIEPSRMQLMVLLLAFSGFILFGKQFISLWVGDSFGSVYALSLILLGSATLQLSQNTISSVLRAKNLLHGKTLILGVSTIVNTVITVILVPRIGATGAAIGTAVSMIFGYGAGLTIYFQRVAGIDMKVYYVETYKGILPATFISTVLGFFIDKIIYDTGWLGFAVKVGIYSSVYVLITLMIGVNNREKALISGVGKSAFARMLHKFQKKSQRS